MSSIDPRQREGRAPRGRHAIVREYPRIGGIDLTGRAVASDDARFGVDDAVVVHGFGIGVDHDGGHAQYARVPADWVMPLPPGLSLFEAAVIGAAGYTAALCLHWMEHNGLVPASGPVLVDGATGGVASIAIDLLSGRGYEVVAMTGKADAEAALRAIGASDVIGRIDPQAQPKPLEKARWAGAVDSVGGDMLAWLARTMRPDGIIAAFGNAGGSDVATTVLPFILRGVKLIGIVANSPMPLRREVWNKLAGAYRPRHLERIGHIITLDALPDHLDRMLAGTLRGRTVIRLAT